MSRRIDIALDPDLDHVAEVAYGITEKLRYCDLTQLHRELVNLCRFHPAKSAQLMACLAAWLDPETPCSVLWARCESITAQRVKTVTG